MNDGELLLRAILDTPEDDTARLVYADWLEENGQPERAEFIRLSCRHSAEGDAVPLNGVDEIMSRWGDLAFNNPDWFPLPFTDWVVGDWPTVKLILRDASDLSFDVRAGFVSSVSLPCAAFLAHAGEIFLRHPVESVKLTDRQPAHGGMATQLRFGWWRSNLPGWNDSHETGHGDLIPYEIWDLLTGNQVSTSWKMYDTSDAAHADLSRACVAYGRAEADRLRAATSLTT